MPAKMDVASCRSEVLPCPENFMEMLWIGKDDVVSEFGHHWSDLLRWLSCLERLFSFEDLLILTDWVREYNL